MDKFYRFVMRILIVISFILLANFDVKAEENTEIGYGQEPINTALLDLSEQISKDAYRVLKEKQGSDARVEVGIYDLNRADYQFVTTYFLYSFCVDGGVPWLSYADMGGGKVRVSLLNTIISDDYFAKHDQVYDQLQQISDECAGKSERAKVEYFYKTIVDKCNYVDRDDTHFMYTVLNHGEACCQGVATTFYRLCYIMNGIPCDITYGLLDGDLELPHAWNRIVVDGVMSTCDLTVDLSGKGKLGFLMLFTNNVVKYYYLSGTYRTMM